MSQEVNEALLHLDQLLINHSLSELLEVINLLESFHPYSAPALPPSSEPPLLIIYAVDEVLDCESCK